MIFMKNRLQTSLFFDWFDALDSREEPKEKQTIEIGL